MKFSHPESLPHEEIVRQLKQLSPQEMGEQMLFDEQGLKNAWEAGDVRLVHLFNVKRWAFLEALRSDEPPEPTAA